MTDAALEAWGGPVPLLLGAAAMAFLGSLLAGVDAAMGALPEARLQALAGAEGPAGAPFRRFLEAREPILSRWLAGRLLAISATAALVFRATQGSPLAKAGPFVPVLVAVG